MIRKTIIFGGHPESLTLTVRNICKCDADAIEKLVTDYLDKHPEKLVAKEKRKPCGCN